MFVDRVSEERREIVWYPQSKNFWEMIDSLIPTPERVLHSSQESVRKYGAPYVLFGTFCCISFTVPYFMWSYEALQEQALMMCLRIIGGVLCGLLIVGDKWPKKLVPHMPIFWHGTLLYCLPFISTVMFLLTNGSVEWLVNVGITLLFLIVLVDWFTFLVLTMLGVALGILFYSLAIGPVNLQLDFSTQYLLIYQAFFATVIGLLFARRRQQRFDYALEQTEDMNITQKLTQQKLLEAFQDKIKILRALKYAGTHELLEVAKMTRELRMYLQANNAPLQTVAAQVETLIIPMVMQLGGVADKALHYVRMNTDMISIMDLLTGVQGRLAKEGKYKNVQVRIRTKHKSLECDPKYIQDLLVDSVQILQKEHGGLPSIIITIEDAKLHYPLPSVGKGYVKNIKALRITVSTQDAVLSSERNYTVDMSTPLQYEDPQNNWELACFEIQRIVKSHYGYTNALTADTLSYALPLHVREVRPKDLDRPHMELGVAPVRANDQYPGAQETERAFLEAVQKHSKADIETVKTILELIKWYHGAVNRKSGEPFYLHPVSVAQIVLEYDTDEATVLGALLHDTVEDTAMLLQDIESVFGPTTANIVDKVTHLESGKGTFYKLTLATEENMAMLAEAGDDRAICVKLADRMHNMRTIKAKPYEKQLRTAKETLQYYVPHAERLGLHNAVREFKERCYDVINNKPEGI